MKRLRGFDVVLDEQHSLSGKPEDWGNAIREIRAEWFGAADGVTINHGPRTFVANKPIDTGHAVTSKDVETRIEHPMVERGQLWTRTLCGGVYIVGSVQNLPGEPFRRTAQMRLWQGDPNWCDQNWNMTVDNTSGKPAFPDEWWHSDMSRRVPVEPKTPEPPKCAIECTRTSAKPDITKQQVWWHDSAVWIVESMSLQGGDGWAVMRAPGRNSIRVDVSGRVPVGDWHMMGNLVVPCYAFASQADVDTDVRRENAERPKVECGQLWRNRSTGQVGSVRNVGPTAVVFSNSSNDQYPAIVSLSDLDRWEFVSSSPKTDTRPKPAVGQTWATSDGLEFRIVSIGGPFARTVNVATNELEGGMDIMPDGMPEMPGWRFVSEAPAAKPKADEGRNGRRVEWDLQGNFRYVDKLISPQLRAFGRALNSMADAMKSEQGRRVMLAQAVDDAVRACPPELNREAYRAALLGSCEHSSVRQWSANGFAAIVPVIVRGCRAGTNVFYNRAVARHAPPSGPWMGRRSARR